MIAPLAAFWAESFDDRGLMGNWQQTCGLSEGGANASQEGHVFGRAFSDDGEHTDTRRYSYSTSQEGTEWE